MASRDPVELGRILGPHGVRGEVRLFLHNPTSDTLARPRPATLVPEAGPAREVRLSARSGAGGRVIGRIDGVDSREAAEALRGARVIVPFDALPAPAPDEFYVHAVLGLAVEVDGAVVGEVVEVHSHGPVDVLELRLADGATAYVPALDAAIAVDAARGRVVVSAGALAEDR